MVENRIDIKEVRKTMLQELLNRLDVPKMRKDFSKQENLLWLQRNLLINNGANPMAEKALEVVKEMLKEMS